MKPGGLTASATRRLALGVCCMLAANAAAAFDRAHFEAYLDGAVAAEFESRRLAGLTMALIVDGEHVFSKGYGAANLETGEPVDPARHLFRPGSVSKLVTWTAVMQLEEQGLLDLDADVGRYVTQFEIPRAFGKPLTLRHILTHTVGLEDGALGYLFRRSPDDLLPLAESLAAHTPAQVRPPGTDPAYSNWAAALAGLIVANVSGMRFEDYVRARIFEPLGMRRSTFEEPLPEALAADMAVGYIERQGSLEPLGFEYIGNFGPAGALSATADDMARFMAAHLRPGGVLMRPDTAARMHATLRRARDGLMGMTYGFLETRRNGQRFIGHPGDTIAFHSQLLLRPESGFGLFLSFNSPDGARARGAIVAAVLDYFFPAEPGGAFELPPFPAEPLAGSAERIARIAGSYRFNRRSYTRLEGVLALFADMPVLPADAPGEIYVPIPEVGGRLVEVEPWLFRQRGRQELIAFELGEDGAVRHALIDSLPIMVADKVPILERADVHLSVIALALLSAVFVIINALRRQAPGAQTDKHWIERPRGALWFARASLVVAAAAYLAFAVGAAVVAGRVEASQVIFDFPPAGTGVVLTFALLGTVATALAWAGLVPVWRSPDTSLGQRLRHTWVALVFAALGAVLWYWNLLGWRYD